MGVRCTKSFRVTLNLRQSYLQDVVSGSQGLGSTDIHRDVLTSGHSRKFSFRFQGFSVTGRAEGLGLSFHNLEC